MIDAIMNQITISDYVDIRLVIFLLALGFSIKHYMRKISNKYIPIILMVSAFVISLPISSDYTVAGVVNSFVTSVIASTIATGCHSSSKSIFKALFKSSSDIIYNAIDSIDDSMEDDEDDESLDL